MSDFSRAKHNMIEQQIRPWEVLDPQVLAVFEELDRDRFVPEHLKGLAYADCQLPVFEGQSMLPPTVEGRMLQALNLKASDCVLQVGTCSGYLTACLARLAQQVDSVDLNPAAAEIATENLAELGIDNINLSTVAGLPDIQHQMRYDAITVSGGSLSAVPENLQQALTIGGRLFVITGSAPAMHARLITRLSQSEWQTTDLFETSIPRLV